MDRYIGVKIVHAEPAWQTRPLEDNEVVTIVTKTSYPPGRNGLGPDTQDGYKVVYQDGYESWSPKSVFEEAYRKTDGLSFGLALEAMKKGCKVSRTGWNGPGMWAVMQKGYPNGININKNTAEATGIPEGTLMKFRPYFMLFTAQGDFAHWVPSGSDILADDWQIVE